MPYIVIPSRRLRQPTYSAQLSSEFPRPSHVWMPGCGVIRDLVGNWHLSPAGNAKLQASPVGMTFETAGGSDTFNLAGAPITATEKFCWLGLVRPDVDTPSFMGPSGNGYVDGGYALRRDGSNYYTSSGSGFGAWTSSLTTTGKWDVYAVQSTSISDYKKLWLKGINLGNTTNPTTGTPAYRRLSGSVDTQFDGAIALSVLWSFPIDDEGVFKALQQNPWALFVPDVRRIYFGTGGGAANQAVAESSGVCVATAMSGSVAGATGSGVTSGLAGAVGLAASLSTAGAIAGVVAAAVGVSTAVAVAGSVATAAGSGAAQAMSGVVAVSTGSADAQSLSGAIGQAAGASFAAAQSQPGSIAAAAGSSSAIALTGSIAVSTGTSTAAGYSSAASLAEAAGSSSALAIAGFIATTTASSSAIAVSGAVGVAVGGSVVDGVGLSGNAAIGTADGASSVFAWAGSIGEANGLATGHGSPYVLFKTVDARYLVRPTGRRFTART